MGENIDDFVFYPVDPWGYGLTWYNDDSTETETINWSDGSTGSGVDHVHDIFASSFTVTNIVGDEYWFFHWPTNYWPSVEGGTQTYYGYGDDTNGSPSDTDSAGSPVMLEHCEINGPPLGGDYSGSYVWPTDPPYLETLTMRGNRHAQAVMHLQTGGKAGWGGLWKIHGCATNIIPVKDPIPIQGITSPALPVPPQDITIDAKILDTNGNIYKALPDDSPPVDVTPYVAGKDFYTFSVEPTKALVSLSLNTSGTNLSSGDDLFFVWQITGVPPQNELGTVSLNNPSGSHPCTGYFGKVEIVGQVPFTPPANFGTFVIGQTNEYYQKLTFNNGNPPQIDQGIKTEDPIKNQQGNPTTDGKIFAIDSPGQPMYSVDINGDMITDYHIASIFIRQNFTTYATIKINGSSFKVSNELEWHNSITLTNGILSQDVGLGHITLH